MKKESAGADASFEASVRALAKRELRRSMQGIRKTLPAATRAVHARAICAAVIEAEFLEGRGSIALYRAILRKGEVDVGPLDLAARQRGMRVAYPLLVDVDFDPRELLARGEPPPPPQMQLRFIDAPTDDAFADQGRGFLEPIAGELADPRAIDVLIVPGLAFDSAGYRVGYGGGHYDRLLALAEGALTVGVAYDFQRVDEVPRDAYDLPVRHLVTEKRVLACASS